MRIVLALLLFANLTLFAYTRLDSGNGEAILLQDQVQPDKIKLLSPQEVAALSPAKVASLADVCVEWGPFSDSDRTRALADLDGLALGRLLSQKRLGAGSTTQTVLVVRDPQQPVVAKLKDLQGQYPGTEIKVTGCERSG